MANDFLKPVSSVVSTRNEIRTIKTVSTSDLIYSLVDRTELSESFTHYFKSVNLPATSATLPTDSTLSQAFPELQQLNVDKFIISAIPNAFYDEIIDGRSVTWVVPQNSGATIYSSVTLVSSTYGTFSKKQNNPLLGNNIAFLFCDKINLPYTGYTDSGVVNKSSVSTWDTTNYLDRPSAVSYQNLAASDINTDQRNWVDVDLATTVLENYPTTTNQGYNYDIPVGFVALDKGLMVITHPSIVDEMPWGLGKISPGGASNPTSGETNIFWNDSAKSTANFYSIDIAYQTSVICIALPNEFFFTNNPTWDYEANLNTYQEGANDFDTTYVTEIGLYNTKNELVAITKLDRPKAKGYTGLLTFTLKLDV
tara:strand:+ start:13287 stop:14387 length:1101 start_codon:yes stop_codon:yes gene_type:complete